LMLSKGQPTCAWCVDAVLATLQRAAGCGSPRRGIGSPWRLGGTSAVASWIFGSSRAGTHDPPDGSVPSVTPTPPLRWCVSVWRGASRGCPRGVLSKPYFCHFRATIENCSGGSEDTCPGDSFALALHSHTAIRAHFNTAMLQIYIPSGHAVSCRGRCCGG